MISLIWCHQWFSLAANRLGLQSVHNTAKNPASYLQSWLLQMFLSLGYEFTFCPCCSVPLIQNRQITRKVLLTFRLVVAERHHNLFIQDVFRCRPVYCSVTYLRRSILSQDVYSSHAPPSSIAAHRCCIHALHWYFELLVCFLKNFETVFDGEN